MPCQSFKLCITMHSSFTENITVKWITSSSLRLLFVTSSCQPAMWDCDRQRRRKKANLHWTFPVLQIRTLECHQLAIIPLAFQQRHPDSDLRDDAGCVRLLVKGKKLFSSATNALETQLCVLNRVFAIFIFKTFPIYDKLKFLQWITIRVQCSNA